jgi:hypothetical protein
MEHTEFVFYTKNNEDYGCFNYRNESALGNGLYIKLQQKLILLINIIVLLFYIIYLLCNRYVKCIKLFL